MNPFALLRLLLRSLSSISISARNKEWAAKIVIGTCAVIAMTIGAGAAAQVKARQREEARKKALMDIIDGRSVQSQLPSLREP
jgi:hypothetical protein